MGLFQQFSIGGSGLVVAPTSPSFPRRLVPIVSWRCARLDMLGVAFVEVHVGASLDFAHGHGDAIIER